MQFKKIFSSLLIVLVFFLLVNNCLWAEESSSIRIVTNLTATPQNIKKLNADNSNSVESSSYACFVLYDLLSQKYMMETNQNQSRNRMPPASTFKIALAAMGYNENILIGSEAPIWLYRDSYGSNIETWQEKQTPKTWIENSVVWYSQQLATAIGMNNFKKYVYAFNYGNKDVTGALVNNLSENPNVNQNTSNVFFPGLTDAWLNSFLKISAMEQIEFLSKLCLDTLPISKEASANTKKLFFIEKTAKGELYGKTGTLIIDSQSVGSTELGWFVGWVKKNNQVFIFAGNRYYFIQAGEESAGKKIKEDIKHLLVKKDLL